METIAIVMEEPERLSLRRLKLRSPAADHVVVDVEWSGISTGTERLLWSGRMPSFPGMGYPLVPGYESIGRIVDAGADCSARIGEQVFVPGSACFDEVRCLFGGAAKRLIVPGARAVPMTTAIAEHGVLIALAATAQHAIAGGRYPELIVGHGILGRLLARLTMLGGAPAPTVWETNERRRAGALCYPVMHPDDDDRRDYRVICDASGDPTILNALIERLARCGEIVLAGFYEKPLSFAFPPSFMKEARIRVAAQWQPEDLSAVMAAIEDGRLWLGDFISHRMQAGAADEAYRTAFGDPACLKMILDWRGVA